MTDSANVNDLPRVLPPKVSSPCASVGSALLALVLTAVPLGGPLAQLVKDLPKIEQSPPANITATDLRNSIESAVTITNRENHDIEEHRVGNNVYMVKVKPRNLPPYYLIDQDGSGNMQWRRGPAERIAVPRWAILKW